MAYTGIQPDRARHRRPAWRRGVSDIWKWLRGDVHRRLDSHRAARVDDDLSARARSLRRALVTFLMRRPSAHVSLGVWRRNQHHFPSHRNLFDTLLLQRQPGDILLRRCVMTSNYHSADAPSSIAGKLKSRVMSTVTRSQRARAIGRRHRHGALCAGWHALQHRPCVLL